MITVEGLTKYYGPYPAVQDLNFHVNEGEIVAFLGPNAAGKTTTMRMLTCYHPPTRGEATIGGQSVWTNSLEVRRQIGYLPEHIAMYEEMSVVGYLRFCAKLRDVPKHELADRVEEVMGMCRVADVADKLIAKLSKGYRQRLGLAQALVHDPPVLILDEPTIGLDPSQIIETRELIKKLSGQRTVMLSTHILPEAQALCERVVIVNHGRVVAEDTPEALMQQLRKIDTILVRVGDTSEEPAKALRAIAEVRAVRESERDSSSVAYFVDTAVGKDLRADLARFVVQKGWGLLELTPVRMSLEDVFFHLVTREEGGN